MSNTLIIGWNRAIAGREKQAMELFQSSIAYWGKKQAAGDIESFEPILMGLHGGDMNGFFMIKGDPAKLDAISHEKDFVNLVMQMGLAIEGVGLNRGFAGDRLMELMGGWGELVAKY